MSVSGISLVNDQMARAHQLAERYERKLAESANPQLDRELDEIELQRVELARQLQPTRTSVMLIQALDA